MPRSNRLPREGGIFHVTQRCHNQSFLLKCARDRQAYRAKEETADEMWVLKEEAIPYSHRRECDVGNRDLGIMGLFVANPATARKSSRGRDAFHRARNVPHQGPARLEG